MAPAKAGAFFGGVSVFGSSLVQAAGHRRTPASLRTPWSALGWCVTSQGSEADHDYDTAARSGRVCPVIRRMVRQPSPTRARSSEGTRP
jgi:hypothetical protein